MELSFGNLVHKYDCNVTKILREIMFDVLHSVSKTARHN